jgi:hypothetical protein
MFEVTFPPSDFDGMERFYAIRQARKHALGPFSLRVGDKRMSAMKGMLPDEAFTAHLEDRWGLVFESEVDMMMFKLAFRPMDQA